MASLFLFQAASLYSALNFPCFQQPLGNFSVTMCMQQLWIISPDYPGTREHILTPGSFSVEGKFRKGELLVLLNLSHHLDFTH